MTSWLTLIAGLRESHFDSGSVSGGTQPAVVENATDPRFGVAIRIPRLNWVFHGFYGEFYQAPPLLTATGPLLDLATSQSSDFRSPARRARSRIPVRRLDSVSRLGARGRHLSDHARRIGWTTAISANRTSSGRITWTAALIQGWETTLRSPRIWHRAQVHAGLLESDRAGHRAHHRRLDLPRSRGSPACPVAVPPGYSPVDHDQRNTLNVGVNAHSSLAGVRLDECVLRLGIHQRDAGRAISGQLSAAAHDVRYFLGKSFGEGEKYSSR